MRALWTILALASGFLAVLCLFGVSILMAVIFGAVAVLAGKKSLRLAPPEPPRLGNDRPWNR